MHSLRKPKLKLKTKEMIEMLRKRRRVLTEQTLIKESTEMTNETMADPIGSLRSLMQDSSRMVCN